MLRFAEEQNPGGFGVSHIVTSSEQKTAELHAHRSSFEHMLHLRARTAAPPTTFSANVLISLKLTYFWQSQTNNGMACIAAAVLSTLGAPNLNVSRHISGLYMLILPPRDV